MEIKKIENSANKRETCKLACERPSVSRISNCNYVMFPRLQHCGLKPEHVEREAFKAELRHVEGHGDYWLLHQQAKPHVVAHVQLPQTEAEFDNILGFCLGENHWCDYIEGDSTFICVIAGFNSEELTPKYPDFISERVYALHAAARWWYEYREDVLLLNNV